ncbi:MAG: PHP domain-containing protein [Alistipes sp.]|nr:PHP domain-containing protein [Alistipes sp.]
MKKLIFTIAASMLALGVSAQYYVDAENPEMLHIGQPRTQQRVAFNVPQINGYNVYKADLHTHSIFSDGDVSIGLRMKEAWADGLDVYAVTEHMEYRPHEKTFIKWLKGYVPEGTKAVNNSLVSKPATEEGIKVDLNVPYQEAVKSAKKYGLTIIPGIEVTRTPETVGHFNALFIKDANTIYDVDPEKAIRNARKQGAIIMHNHPGWRRKDLNMIEFEQKVYDKGLIDGVEIMNGTQFYPKVIDRAKKYGLFMTATTDIHATTAELYALNGCHRNMTFILAKDNSLESLREAIEAKRTLAYSFGTVAGDEQLLRDLFDASVKVVNVSASSKPGRYYVMFENVSSIDFLLRVGETGELVTLKGDSSISIRVKEEAGTMLTVENLWCGADKHITVDLKPVLKSLKK